jgi:hypothetical protein
LPASRALAAKRTTARYAPARPTRKTQMPIAPTVSAVFAIEEVCARSCAPVRARQPVLLHVYYTSYGPQIWWLRAAVAALVSAFGLLLSSFDTVLEPTSSSETGAEADVAQGLTFRNSQKSMQIFTVIVAERLRRLTRNQLGSARAGSSPADDDLLATYLLSSCPP